LFILLVLPNAMFKEFKNWILLISLSLIWGSSFILMNKGMFTSNNEKIFSFEQVGALRMLIASIALSPFALKALQKIKDKKILLGVLIVGVLGNFIPAFLFPFAQTGLTSGFAGMLNSFTPIFTVIIGYIIFGSKLGKSQILGMAIGTVGIILLMYSGSQVALTGNWTHIAAILMATLMYAISLNTIKHKLSNLKAIEVSSLAFFLLLIPSLIAIFLTKTHTTLLENPNASYGLIFIGTLSIFGTAIAVILFNELIKNSSTVFASSVTYFIPVVAVTIGLLFNESLSIWQIGSMMIVLLGVFFINIWDSLKAKQTKTK
jgi:drug/metabolite transporter (DMT)-like permease